VEVTDLYAELEPYDHGLLDVGDGNRVHWELCGNPTGKSAVVLHGGPGSGCSPELRRFFDPSAYRVVLFDQRGCGHSTPHAGDPTTDLSVNTTAHLLADMELLRAHLDIERWLAFGISWGTTLALAYAQRHLDRVTAMILVGVTTSRQLEIDWLYRGVAPLFPEEWERFLAGVPDDERDGDLVAAYHRLVEHPDPAVRTKAASDWNDWDWATSSVDPNAKCPPRWEDEAFQLARARIVTHFFHHRAWLPDGILLRNAGALADIPGVMINGRLDLQAPLVTAWQLARRWPGSELVVVPDAGHSTTDAGMSDAIIDATDRFGDRP
jgi:proline iminopeptidase